jgi:hypothetical protein
LRGREWSLRKDRKEAEEEEEEEEEERPVIWLALNLLKTLVLLRLVDPQWFYSRLGMVKIQKLG